MRRAGRAPDGIEWLVARRVLPWRPRLRRDPWDVGLIGLLLQILSLPLLVVEVLLASIVQTTRIVTRRPWRVEAWTDGPPRQRLLWRVRGFRAAGAHAAAVAEAIVSTGDGPTVPDERQVG